MNCFSKCKTAGQKHRKLLLQMGLPAKLTEDEQALLEKYALLKKLRKELQQKQAATAAENQKATSTTKKEGADVARAPIDAKELAKRKILSGELKIRKDAGQREFKRARSINDKRQGEKSRLDDVESNDIKIDQDRKQTKGAGRGVYDNFVSGGRLKESSPVERQDHGRPRYVDRGRKKIFVSGYDLTEAILQNSFTKFGTIVNVHAKLDRGQGFITFASHEAAEKAIAEMHGEMVQNVTLKVCMAGKPHRSDGSFERRPFEDRRPLPPTRPSKESRHGESFSAPYDDSRSKNDRQMVQYDDEFSF